MKKAFPKLSSQLNPSRLEEKILKFWERNKIFARSLRRNRGKKRFVFFEGPPTANARPGLHHVEARAFKDVLPRYKTMRGFLVERKAGWDTQGLPIELEVEKKLGIKAKPEIERFGIARFNAEARKSAWRYKKEWEKLTRRIGFWLDLKDPYITYQPDYIETLWWIIKEIWKKGWLYQGERVVHYCPRCGTTLSSHEVAQGYEEVKDPSIFVKFEDLNEARTFYLVWTTTPWTLPGNTALAVDPSESYLKLSLGGEKLIIAAKRRQSLPGLAKARLVRRLTGRQLLERHYRPLYDQRDKSARDAWYKVRGADFVSMEEGTGIIHIAPAFGAEDYELFLKQGAPLVKSVDDRGRIKVEGPGRGLFVKAADPLIIEDLRKRGLIFREGKLVHSYPLCWRCATPLLQMARSSWFIKMSSLTKQLLANNAKVNWIPISFREGRFGEWLREVKDWSFSRERFWGTPLPIWRCGHCKRIKVIGSVEEMRKQGADYLNLFVFRHGEAEHNIQGIISSGVDDNIHLTEKGKKDVGKLAETIIKGVKPDALFSSDLPRSKETVEILAKKLNVEIIFDKRLREINTGILNGQKQEYYDKLVGKREGKFEKKPEGGETILDVRKRMANFLKDTARKYSGKTVFVVSHGDPLWMLQSLVLGIYQKEDILKIAQIPLAGFKNLKYFVLPINNRGEIDLHRPYVDEIKIKCGCGHSMKRAEEVVDAWFDSGAMPFAQWHYPFENRQRIDPSTSSGQAQSFPADYIAEGVDQTRGWFYTLLAVSTLLGRGPAYKNVISLGHVLDERGKKMSKSKGNVVDPWQMLERYGADALRFYFYSVNQSHLPKNFAEKDLNVVLRGVLLPLWNCLVFFTTYARANGFSPTNAQPRSSHILDRWILARLFELRRDLTEKLESFDLYAASLGLKAFIEDLSRWYLRRSRRRFFKNPDLKDQRAAQQTLFSVLRELSKLAAPFVPFLAEELYRTLRLNPDPASVHLQAWPQPKQRAKTSLLKGMREVRRLAEVALRLREEARIKVRQPLSTLYLARRLPQALAALLRDELNVQKIQFSRRLPAGKAIRKDERKGVALDTSLTPALKLEGLKREVVRLIQEMRKRARLTVDDRAELYWFSRDQLARKLFIERGQEIASETLSILREEKKEGAPLELNGCRLSLRVRRL